MLERVKKWMGRLVCHRVLYGSLGVVYLSGCLGADALAVYAPAVVLYALLAWRG